MPWKPNSPAAAAGRVPGTATPPRKAAPAAIRPPRRTARRERRPARISSKLGFADTFDTPSSWVIALLLQPPWGGPIGCTGPEPSGTVLRDDDRTMTVPRRRAARRSEGLGRAQGTAERRPRRGG